MLTFILCIAALVVGYIFYGKRVDKIFGSDDRETPAIALNDGVDFVPMKGWKIFLVQLLNIAGLGPIFGALNGALFGPVVYLWIVFGTIFAGGVHDYMCGMLSMRHKGASISEITGTYLGKVMLQVMRVFSVILLVMVGVVFSKGPAGLLALLTPEKLDATFWLWVIIIYYFIATFVPIDKVIGKIYPIFGICLIIMAVGVAGVLLFAHEYQMPELWNNFYNQHPQNIHIWPFMFVTVACGAISGFHATQSPLMARCMKSEKQGRMTFYNMMVLEGFIAMVWAAGAMGVYNLALQEPNAGLATGTVGVVCKYLLGHVGGIIALLGVIVLPITSGDTALRALRLSLSETLHIDQSTNGKRIKLAVPIFALVIAILVFAKTNADGFNILWRYFAWANQTLSLFAFLCITAWMFENGKGKWAWIPMIPGCFYTFICVTYIANAHIGFNIPWTPAYIIGVACAVAYVVACCMYGKKRAAKLLAK